MFVTLKKTSFKLQLHRIFIDPKNPYQPPTTSTADRISPLTLTLLGVPAVLLVAGFGKHLLSAIFISGWTSFFEAILPLSTIFFAIFVASAMNPMHSLLSLLGVFFNVVLLYVGSAAEYLGIVLLIVYVGAISVLFLFVLMLFNVKAMILSENLIKHLSQVLSILGAIFLFVQLNFRVIQPLFVGLLILSIMPWEATSAEAIAYYVQYVAADITALVSLYTTHGFLFAVITMVVLSALLGAIILATATTERATSVYDVQAFAGGRPVASTVGVVFLTIIVSTIPAGALDSIWGLNFFIFGSSKLKHFLTHQIFPRLRITDFLEDTTTSKLTKDEIEEYQFFKDRRSDHTSPYERRRRLWRWRSARARSLYRAAVPIRRVVGPYPNPERRGTRALVHAQRLRLLRARNGSGVKKRRVMHNVCVPLLDRFSVTVEQVRPVVTLRRLGLFGYIRAFWRTRTIPWLMWWSWRVNAFSRNFLIALFVLPHLAAVFYWFWSDYGIAIGELIRLYGRVDWYFATQVPGFSSLPSALQVVLPAFLLWPAAALNIACSDFWWITVGAAAWADFTIYSGGDRTQDSEDFAKSCTRATDLAYTFSGQTPGDDGMPVYRTLEELARSKRHPDAGRSDSEGSAVPILALSGLSEVDCVDSMPVVGLLLLLLVVVATTSGLYAHITGKGLSAQGSTPTTLPVSSSSMQKNKISCVVWSNVFNRNTTSLSRSFLLVFLLTPPRMFEPYFSDCFGNTTLYRVLHHTFTHFYGPTTAVLFCVIVAALLNSVAGLLLCVFWRKMYPHNISRGPWNALWYTFSTAVMLYVFITLLLVMPPFNYTYHFPVLALLKVGTLREVTILSMYLSVPFLVLMYYRLAHRLDTREIVVPRMFGARVWVNYAVSRISPHRRSLRNQRAREIQRLLKKSGGPGMTKSK